MSRALVPKTHAGVELAPALALALVACAPQRAVAPPPHVAGPLAPAVTAGVPPRDPAPTPAPDPTPAAPPVAPATPLANRTCAVRWSADGARVAGVSDRAVEIRAVGGGPTTVLAADPGTRTLDYSFGVDMVLRERAGKDELVKAGVHDPYFVEDGQRWIGPLVLSDDGWALFHASRELAPALDDSEFMDLHTWKEVPVDVPFFAAGGSSQVVTRVRRQAIEVTQSRILGAIYAYWKPKTDHDDVRGLSLPNCFAMQGEGTGKLFGIDVDEAFTTAIVARVPCEKANKRPVIEVYEQMGGGKPMLARAWSPSGAPVAVDLAANGGRALVTLDRGGAKQHELWDVTHAKLVGSVAFEADCFELSPDGSKIAAMKGSVLDVRAVP